MSYSPGYYGAFPNYGYPGGASTVIPLLELSGNLMVAFGRNQKAFAVNRVAKVQPVKSTVGTFMQFNPLDVMRATPNTAAPYGATTGALWPPNTPSPTGFDDTYGYTVGSFRCQRYRRVTTLDQRAVDVASFPIMSTHTARLGQLMMTERAIKTYGVLFTQANYQSTHVQSATALAGSFLDMGTTSNPVLMNALNAATRQIQKDTAGAVRYGSLTAVMNPDTALALAATPEIREYLMQQKDSIKNIHMTDEDYNGVYGLPPRLYNMNVVVDDTVFNNYNQGDASEGGQFVVPDNQILIILMEGDMEVPEGASDFSTCHMFSFEEFNLETKVDPYDRITYLACTMDADWQIVAPQTGFIITDVFS